MEHDDWLASERRRLLTWDRERLIGWLQWNDPNGIWSDEDMLANDMDPMTVEDAVDQIMAFVEETGETPEEMMRGSLSANPGRYPKPAEFDPYLKGSPIPSATGSTRLSWGSFSAKDEAAAEALYEMLGADVHNVDITINDGEYQVEDSRTGEVWNYDGANEMWFPKS